MLLKTMFFIYDIICMIKRKARGSFAMWHNNVKDETYWNAQYPKGLLDKVQIYDLLELIHKMPTHSQVDHTKGTKGTWLFIISDWRSKVNRIVESLDIELKSPTWECNYQKWKEDVLWELMFSYRRLKKLERDEYDQDLMKAIVSEYKKLQDSNKKGK
jgi:hypothetical protein